MKQTQGDKHTIAWFKIAECVSRGEKERAFGVYRLLSHSFNDNAIARQLEADIYCSFGEIEQAIALYQQAMECYAKSDRFLEAAAIGEHLIHLRPADMVLYRKMIQLYISLVMVAKVRSHLYSLIDLLAQKQQWYEIKNIFEECARFDNDTEKVSVYADVIINADKAGCPSDIIIFCVEQALNDLSLVDNKKCVQNFMSLLQAHSDKLYNHALTYLKK